MRSPAFVLFLVASVVSGCGAFADLHGDHSGGSRTAPPPPRVRLVEVRLGAHPSGRQLAAHYCTDVPAGTHLGPAGQAACRALGAAPSDAQLQFHLEVELEVTNPTSVRVPLAQVLVGLTPFPAAADAHGPGAVCLTLCPAGETCPQSEAATACQSESPEITDLDSLGDVASGFLTSVALSEEHFDGLRIQEVAPHGTVRFVAELALATEPMLALIERTNAAAVEQARAGTALAIEIPYAVDGSIWVDAHGFGPQGASFPRTEGTWTLEGE
jgi:hypothetical protein